mgnify:CR=1 FL=1
MEFVLFINAYLSKLEFIVLLKETSVAGYIALQDLTRGGDIIRSQTYDAFFPLIAVALIYFAITWIIALLMDTVRKKTDPKRRKNNKIKRNL